MCEVLCLAKIEERVERIGYPFLRIKFRRVRERRATKYVKSWEWLSIIVLVVVGIAIVSSPVTVLAEFGTASIGAAAALTISVLVSIETRVERDRLNSEVKKLKEPELMKYRAAATLSIHMSNYILKNNQVESKKGALEQAAILDNSPIVGSAVVSFINEYDKLTSSPSAPPLLQKLDDDMSVKRAILSIDGAQAESAYIAVRQIVLLLNALPTVRVEQLDQGKQLLLRLLSEIGVEEYVIDYVSRSFRRFVTGPCPSELQILLRFLYMYLQNLGADMSPSIVLLRQFFGNAPPIDSNKFNAEAEKTLEAIMKSPDYK